MAARIRCQVPELASTAPHLRAAVFREGCITPKTKGRHYVGATRDESRTDVIITNEDHHINPWRAANVLTDVFYQASRFARRDWVAVRCASRDRAPVIGAADNILFCYFAMGSPGFGWTPSVAEIMASIAANDPVQMERTVFAAFVHHALLVYHYATPAFIHRYVTNV